MGGIVLIRLRLTNSSHLTEVRNGRSQWRGGIEGSKIRWQRVAMERGLADVTFRSCDD
jgi:hypothetical protein